MTPTPEDTLAELRAEIGGYTGPEFQFCPWFCAGAGYETHRIADRDDMAPELADALAASQGRVREQDRLLREVDYILGALEPKLDRISTNSDELIRQRAASQERARELEGLMWQRCPVCDGRGDHMRGFYDGPGPTSSGGTTRVACRTCNGLTVIRTVVPPRAPSTASTKDSGAVGEGGVHE